MKPDSTGESTWTYQQGWLGIVIRLVGGCYKACRILQVNRRCEGVKDVL